MDKRPANIIEDDFSRVVGLELKRSLIGGKSELISCSYKIPPTPFPLILLGSWGVKE